MEIQANVEVLDSEICKECKLLQVGNYPEELFGDDEVISLDNHYKCDRLNECKYLYKLFASKATPTVEEAESNP